MLTTPSQPFTVSRLNRTVRLLLEDEIGLVWLTGELSNLVLHGSGHWYFSLKDPGAQVRCAMFRGNNRRVAFRPQEGQQVLVQARLSLYEPRGDYQLVVESMRLFGEGQLQLQLEQLKQRLQAEGLFDVEHKRPLPSHPRQIGIITSPTGAAIRDMLQVLARRAPDLPVVIYPSPVQGAEAAPRLLQALELAWTRNECDVLLIGRGGGALEDLWSFNDERLVRAIAHSPIPIIRAIVRSGWLAWPSAWSAACVIAWRCSNCHCNSWRVVCSCRIPSVSCNSGNRVGIGCCCAYNRPASAWPAPPSNDCSCCVSACWRPARPIAWPGSVNPWRSWNMACACAYSGKLGKAVSNWRWPPPDCRT